MELYYQEERDKNFFDACEAIRRQHKGYISISDIAKKAIHMPAKSFYLSPRKYVIIIRKDISTLKSEAKKKLYKEIQNRYAQLKQKFPNLNMKQIASIISEQEAPRFYISEDRAIILYYKLLKQPIKII